MYPTLFQLGAFPVHSYGLMVMLGFSAGVLLTLYYARREGIPAEN